MTMYNNVIYFFFYNYFFKMFGTDKESKIVIFYPSTKLGISFVISGQTILFFNQFVNFPNLLKNDIDFVL